jgi:hypothetical protein
MLGNYRVAAHLVASRELLNSIELVKRPLLTLCRPYLRGLCLRTIREDCLDDRENKLQEHQRKLCFYQTFCAYYTVAVLHVIRVTCDVHWRLERRIMMEHVLGNLRVSNALSFVTVEPNLRFFRKR